MTAPVLRASRLRKTYRNGAVAVDDVTLEIGHRECVGLVGQSGSGKSTLGRCLLGLERLDGGTVSLAPGDDGEPNTAPMLQMVFQHPQASFNSRMRLIDSLLEPLRCHPARARALLAESGLSHSGYVDRLMDLVHLDRGMVQRFPRELSGGQLQRMAIARALAVRPSLVVLDEPTSGLDVPVQATVLNLLKDLQDELGLSYLFISHDLAAVTFMSERVNVMKEARIVDSFPSTEVFSGDRHPYTQNLTALFSDDERRSR